MARVSVLGAGSWGTALALVIARNGHSVTLWGHRADHMKKLAADRCNHQYLPQAEFPHNMEVEGDLALAVRASDVVLVSVPSHGFRRLLLDIAPHLTAHTKLAWATKGLEAKTGEMHHLVVAEVFGAAMPAAVLSGPTFAKEVAIGHPTAMTVASANVEFAKEMAAILHSPTFRAYSTTDVIGVQLGGATKNIFAIAAGLADGLGFGANARAALITRGLAEMMRLGITLGGRPETLMGLAGVGDLILTCTDNQSRNRRFGLGLGKGQSREAVAREIGQEIEGIAAASVVYRVTQERGIEMPITEQTYRILYENLPPTDAVSNLLLRDPKPESTLG